MASRSPRTTKATQPSADGERQRSLFDTLDASERLTADDVRKRAASDIGNGGNDDKDGKDAAGVEKANDHSVAGPLKGRVEDQFEALPHAWKALVAPFVQSEAYAPLCQYVDAEVAAGKTVYPADIFHALRMTSPQDVKVVILGQDPYHGDDHGIAQAHGMAFSVQHGVRVPPSLRNIYKEIERDLGIAPPAHGNLDAWAKQGVLLLNTTLTVEAGNAASHAKPFKKGGWQACTDTLLCGLAAQQGPLVFMLWGSHAQAKAPLLSGHGHLLLEAPHPSPLSAHRGFLGCGHFSAANVFLTQHGKSPIDWRVPA
ncbi:uracil-DNA glycosylase [Pandoraea vervacti]|uniref:uracil-DNA glycosylase n=1 Tax=Pandoraea vervacti TaxID=656178 RepID=UPI000A0597E3|nr:uracil-DNA glycosylase [Pandoraea vervacti]